MNIIRFRQPPIPDTVARTITVIALISQVAFVVLTIYFN